MSKKSQDPENFEARTSRSLLNRVSWFVGCLTVSTAGLMVTEADNPLLAVGGYLSFGFGLLGIASSLTSEVITRHDNKGSDGGGEPGSPGEEPGGPNLPRTPFDGSGPMVDWDEEFAHLLADELTSVDRG